MNGNPLLKRGDNSIFKKITDFKKKSSSPESAGRLRSNLVQIILKGNSNCTVKDQVLFKGGANCQNRVGSYTIFPLKNYRAFTQNSTASSLYKSLSPGVRWDNNSQVLFKGKIVMKMRNTGHLKIFVQEPQSKKRSDFL
jgi:hypothetical protein